MTSASLEARPSKKRRFFVEEEQSADATLASTPSLPDEIKAPSHTKSDNAVDTGENIDAAERNESSTLQDAFDVDLFFSIVGEKVADEIIRKLQDISGNDVQRGMSLQVRSQTTAKRPTSAINAYFDGSWKTVPSPPQQPSSISKFASLAPSQPETSVQESERSRPNARSSYAATNRPQKPHAAAIPEKRYLGALGVAGWATRSGSGLIHHGEKVGIERTKPRTDGNNALKSFRFKSLANKRQDIIVRFTNSQGSEVGRLENDSAAWISTLLDQRICSFEGTVVFAPDKLRTNDTVYLQLRCYALKDAFEAGSLMKPLDNNRQTGLYELKETQDERGLRLRQVALVKLFDEICLHPTRINKTTEQHKRQGLLQSAEVAEHYDQQNQQTSLQPANGGDSSPPSEEVEEGAQLEQDQLDSLYKKAQSFDFNTPETEPADTFAMELRKYQKQALHWMIGKEKQEDSEHKHMSMHPLWEEYAWPVKDVDSEELPEYPQQSSFYVNPYSGELSLDFPVQEQNCLGGILADGMYHAVQDVLQLTDVNCRDGTGQNYRNAEPDSYP